MEFARNPQTPEFRIRDTTDSPEFRRRSPSYAFRTHYSSSSFPIAAERRPAAIRMKGRLSPTLRVQGMSPHRWDQLIKKTATRAHKAPVMMAIALATLAFHLGSQLDRTLRKGRSVMLVELRDHFRSPLKTPLQRWVGTGLELRIPEGGQEDDCEYPAHDAPFPSALHFIHCDHPESAMYIQLLGAM